MKKRVRTLALILAGGAGGRLETLTSHRAKPAVPFCGTHRLIDFPLSNCVNSQLSDVWVVEQYQPHHLNDHLANGRPWDLDRTLGGMQVLPPYTGREGEGFAEGNADALHRNAGLIREQGCDLLLVLSADHLYRLDFRDVVDAHLETGADLTVVTTRVKPDEAHRFAVVECQDGQVRRFSYKPEQPQSDQVCAEIFLYSVPQLLQDLDTLAEQHGKLKDYGHQLLPFYVQQRRVSDFPLPGYWRDVGTIPAYLEAHRDVLEGRFSLHDTEWLFRSRIGHYPPARVHGEVNNCLLAPACHAAGRLSHTVVAPEARIEEGCRVEHCVLLHRAQVAADTHLRHAILDDGARVERDVELLGTPEQPVLVAQGATVPSGTRLGPGGRWPPEKPET